MATNVLFHDKTMIPGENDLVIHFRDFSLGAGHESPNETNVFMTIEGQPNHLSFPPYAFYERIIQAHGYDTIWIAVDPKTQAHSIVQAIVDNFGARIHGGTVEEDFQFLSFARHFVPATSTFSWWAAFFGPEGRTIHWPVVHSGSAPWCNLLWDGNGARHVYHDWFHNIECAGLDEARQQCLSTDLRAREDWLPFYHGIPYV